MKRTELLKSTPCKVPEREFDCVIAVSQIVEQDGQGVLNIDLFYYDFGSYDWGIGEEGFTLFFEKDVPLEKVLEYPFPEADGYGGFWHNPITMQHPLAKIEIVPWDSGLTLFFSKDKELVQKVRCGFPQSEDLTAYNTRKVVA